MKADACPSGSAGNAASVRTFPTAVSACGRVLVLAERSDATCTKTSTRPIVSIIGGKWHYRKFVFIVFERLLSD